MFVYMYMCICVCIYMHCHAVYVVNWTNAWNAERFFTAEQHSFLLQQEGYQISDVD